MKFSVIPFSKLISGLMHDNQITMKEALKEEMQHFMVQTYPGGVPIGAIMKEDPEYPLYCKFFLAAYMCRKKDAKLYLDVMTDPDLNFSLDDLNEYGEAK